MGKVINREFWRFLKSYFFHLGNYASENKLGPDDKFFQITRVRAWQIIKQCAEKTGLDSRRIYPHLMRHSGALARLKRTAILEACKCS